MTPEVLLSIASAKGLPSIPMPSGGKPYWTVAECAMACHGIDAKHYNALRYTYALDDSVRHSLKTRLWEWAAERREVESWPSHVVDLDGKKRRYLIELADILMTELRSPARFTGLPNNLNIRRVMLNVSEPTWRRKVSPVYEAMLCEYIVWLSIGVGQMRSWLREDVA